MCSDPVVFQADIALRYHLSPPANVRDLRTSSLPTSLICVAVYEQEILSNLHKLTKIADMMNEAFDKQAHVYASRQSTQLRLDVYRSKQPHASGNILLWFHGGYLITGSRIAIPGWLLNHALGRGWTVVSPDYRVLPESTGLDTIEDLQAAYKWTANSLTSLYSDCDANRIIIAGASAGGWCTIVSALHFSEPAALQQPERIPPPKALLLIYPMVDIGSEKWAQSVSLPDAHVDQQIKENLLLDIPRRISQQEISVGEDFPTSEEEIQTSERLPLLYSVMEAGTYLDYLTGVPGFGKKSIMSGLKTLVEQYSRLKPLFPLLCDFASTFPPTIIVHGTADRGVSCSESEALLVALRTACSHVQYFPEPGADHAFDRGWGQPNGTLSLALSALDKSLEDRDSAVMT